MLAINTWKTAKVHVAHMAIDSYRQLLESCPNILEAQKSDKN